MPGVLIRHLPTNERNQAALGYNCLRYMLHVTAGALLWPLDLYVVLIINIPSQFADPFEKLHPSRAHTFASVVLCPVFTAYANFYVAKPSIAFRLVAF